MIYLDNNATTPLHPEVKKKIISFLDKYGNPSSAHSIGREVRFYIEEARKEVASFFNCLPEEIIFTASGSEANNTILKSMVKCCSNSCSTESVHIISSSIEHPSVLNTLKCIEHQHVEVTYLPVDQYGMVNPDDVRKAIKKNTSLISIMFANNEIGTIQPIEEIGKIAKEYNIPFHTDAVQAVGKVKIDLSKMDFIDYLTLSGHKIYAPKGIGALYKRNGTKPICPLINGGHQEFSLRAGTENTIGIVALGEAFRQLKIEMDEEVARIKYLRDKLENGLKSKIENIKINGHPVHRLPGTLNVSFKNIEGESILLRLDLYGIAVSTGSACSTGSLEPSHVISAICDIPEIAHSSVRFSLGRENTEDEIDRTIDTVKEVVEFLRKISPIV
ncbi:MAG TPA: cysteine desulfurase family protein [Spirochaetota bacterium]|nr:cysteine desulfurase family protein [Spirochaetota bacterium]HOL57019.1 cysteine desulfurase family protein [Spirochaetota bacterium]HPP04598.1 cysteine desulfurase family protein [Spirochaetota bacterium]